MKITLGRNLIKSALPLALLSVGGVTVSVQNNKHAIQTAIPKDSDKKNTTDPFALTLTGLAGLGAVGIRRKENAHAKLIDLPADEDGWTDLHYLCREGNLKAIKKILENHPNININQKTSNGRTYMSIARHNDYEDIVNLIAGMDNYNPTIPDEDGWTDLHYLCRDGYSKAIKIILEKHPNININQQTNDGRTYMSIAIKNRHSDIVDLLLNENKPKPKNILKDYFANNPDYGNLYTANDMLELIRNMNEEDIINTENILTTPIKEGDSSILMYIADIMPTEENAKKYDKIIKILSGVRDVNYNFKDEMGVSFLEKVIMSENSKLLDLLKDERLEYYPELEYAYENIQNPEFKEKVKELNIILTDTKNVTAKNITAPLKAIALENTAKENELPF